MRPPALARTLLRTAAGARDRSFVLADLDTEFERLAAADPDAARRWYWRQALSSAAPLVRARLAARQSIPPLTGLVEDARQAARWVRRHPWVSATVASTLAVAFGAALAALAVADATVWHPLPYPQADEIVRVWVTGPTRPAAVRAVSRPDFFDWRGARSFEELTAYAPIALRLNGRGDPREIDAVRVERGFDRVTRVPAALGRLLTDGDFGRGAPAVVVLQYNFWVREFGGDPAVIGRALTLDDRTHEIVGVLQASRVPLPLERHDVWVPLVPRDGAFWETSRGAGWLTVLGRLRRGVPVGAAEAELTAIAGQLEKSHPSTNGGKVTGRVTPLADEIAGPVVPVLTLLSGALGGVVVIACGNIASLLLAARFGRRREFAVRAALGAARARIARQVFAENLILCAVGAAGAVALAPWMANVFVARFPGALHSSASLGVTGTMTLACAAAALVTALLLTAPQVSHSQRLGIPAGIGSRMTASRGDWLLRRGLVVLQIALSFVLLVAGAGLARTVQRLSALDPGFRAEGVVTFGLTPAREKYPSAGRTLDFYQSIVDAIQATPGVRSAAAALAVPLTSSSHRFGLRPPGSSIETLVSVNHAMPRYFETLGIALRAGRLLTPEEHRDARVAVVNETLADALGGLGQAIGMRIPYAGAPWLIVGVVEGSRQRQLREPPAAELFLPWRLAGARPQTIVVRTDGNPLALLPAIAARIHDLDPGVPMARTATLASRLEDARRAETFRAALVGALAMIAIALAALGAYGVTACAVAARSREYGVRLALGERPRTIAGRALWTAVGPALQGIAAGVVIAIAGSRWIEGFLYEVSARSGATLAAAGALLLALALAAGARSAVTAARTDPVNALRMDT